MFSLNLTGCLYNIGGKLGLPVNMNDTVNFSLQYTDYPIAVYAGILYLAGLLAQMLFNPLS